MDNMRYHISSHLQLNSDFIITDYIYIPLQLFKFIKM